MVLIRILRKNHSVKKHKVAVHIRLHERSVTLSWSLAQLAALSGMSTSFRVSLAHTSLRPHLFYLKKKACEGPQSRNCIFYLWNTLLSSVPFLALGSVLYSNSFGLSGVLRSNFLVQNKLTNTDLYFYWLNLHLRSSFLVSRQRRISTVVIANTVFFESFATNFLKKFFFNCSNLLLFFEGVWLSNFSSFLRVNTPFSTSNNLKAFYPFFLITGLFSCVDRYFVFRYLLDWQYKVFWSDSERSFLENDFSFFLKSARRRKLQTCGGLNAVIGQKILVGAGTEAKFFNSVEAEFYKIIHEEEAEVLQEFDSWDFAYEEDYSSFKKIQDEFSGLQRSKFFFAFINHVVHGLGYWRFNILTSDLLKFIRGVDLSFTLKLASIDLSLSVFSKTGLFIDFKMVADYFNYHNINNPLLLFLSVVRGFALSVYKAFYLCAILWLRGFFVYLCEFFILNRFKPYFFSIKGLSIRVFFKKILKVRFFIYLILYCRLYFRFFRILLSVLFGPQFVAFQPMLLNRWVLLAFSLLVLGLVCFLAIGVIGWSMLNFFLLLLFVEFTAYYFFIRFSQPVTYLNRALDNLLQVLTGVRDNIYYFLLVSVLVSALAALQHFFMFWLSAALGLLAWVRSAKLLDLMTLFRFLAYVTVNDCSTFFLARRRVDFEDWIVLDWSRLCWVLISRLIVVVRRAQLPILGKFTFYTAFYSFILSDSTVVFWLYFFNLLGNFGGFGWWVSSSDTRVSNRFLIGAFYLAKLLQNNAPFVMSYMPGGGGIFMLLIKSLRLGFLEGAVGRNLFYFNSYAAEFRVFGGFRFYDKLLNLRLRRNFLDLFGEYSLVSVFSTEYPTRVSPYLFGLNSLRGRLVESYSLVKRGSSNPRTLRLLLFYVFLYMWRSAPKIVLICVRLMINFLSFVCRLIYRGIVAGVLFFTIFKFLSLFSLIGVYVFIKSLGYIFLVFLGWSYLKNSFYW